MALHFILDIVLIIAAVCIVARCWKQGLVASLIRLVGTIAAYAAAWFFSGPIAQRLYQLFVEERLLDYAGTLVPTELQSLPPELLEAASRFPEVHAQIADTVNAAFADAGFQSDMPIRLVNTEGIGDRLLENLLDTGGTVSQSLVKVIMEPAALALTRVLVFVIIFAILSAVVGVLFRMSKIVNHIPLVGGLNRLAGMGAGLVEAAIVLYVAAMLLYMAATVFSALHIPFLHSDVLAQSTMLRWITGWELPEALRLLPT